MRVRRGAEIGSDHYLVEAKIHQPDLVNHSKSRRLCVRVGTQEVIRTHKLGETDIARLYRERVEKTLSGFQSDKQDLEHVWSRFKDTLINIAKEVCGTNKVNRSNHIKRTEWWTDEVQREVKLKKFKWKKYLRESTQDSYKEYKEQRRKVKDIIFTAKKRSWEEFGTRMENDFHRNQKLFYKILKNARKGNQQAEAKQVKDADGNILNEGNQIMSRWKQYFEELLHTEELEEIPSENEFQTQAEDSNTDEIHVDEVIAAVKSLKKGKTPGHDRITGDMLKNMGTKGIEMLTTILNQAWKEAKIPADWKVGIIVPIFKKGDKRECRNYRGITLLSTPSKVYEQILQKKLVRQSDEVMEQSQSGFRKGRSINDHIFTLKQITEKSIHRNIEVYQAFIDLEKAFDRIPRTKIRSTLEKRNVDNKLIAAIMSLHDNNCNYVRTDNMQSEAFAVNNGLRQGGVLSPTLFNLVLDEAIKQTREATSKMYIGHRHMQPVYISECAFADDLVVFGKNEKELQKNLEVWNVALGANNMKVNEEKTKIMITGRGSTQTNISLNQRTLDQVDTFRYLGVQLNDKGYHDAEINARLENTSKLYHSLRIPFIGKREISGKTKITVYKTVFVPTLTFGCETWVLTKSMKSKLQAMEMKYLRRVAGVTKMDKIRNTDIRQMLGVQPLIKVIEDRQLKWFGHLARLSNEIPVKQTWEARRHEKRMRGRPRKTWDDNIKEIRAGRGMSLTQARTLARDKREWQKVIYGDTNN